MVNIYFCIFLVLQFNLLTVSPFYEHRPENDISNSIVNAFRAHT